MKSSQHTTSLPALTTLSDILQWHVALQQVHQRLAPYFARPEPFQRALRFVQGILSSVERKNGWQLAEQAREANPYGMQRLLSQATWDADGVRDEVRRLALETLGTRRIIAALDETSFLKRGKRSAGRGQAVLRLHGRCPQLPSWRLSFPRDPHRTYPGGPRVVPPPGLDHQSRSLPRRWHS